MPVLPEPFAKIANPHRDHHALYLWGTVPDGWRFTDRFDGPQPIESFATKGIGLAGARLANDALVQAMPALEDDPVPDRDLVQVWIERDTAKAMLVYRGQGSVLGDIAEACAKGLDHG